MVHSCRSPLQTLRQGQAGLLPGMGRWLLGALDRRGGVMFVFKCLRVRERSLFRPKAADASKVDGGWSAFLRAFLEFALYGAEAGFMSTGVPLDLGGRSVLLFAKVSIILADGDGLRASFQCTGHAGAKPCFKHHNVLSKGSERAVHSDDHVEITSHEPSRFRLWGYQDLCDTIDALLLCRDRVLGGSLPKVRLENMQRMTGYKPTADGLLACQRLRTQINLLGVARYDWVHVFLADGLLSTEVWLTIDAARRAGLCTVADLQVEIARWSWPKSQRGQLVKLFDESIIAASEGKGRLCCSASDLLTLFRLLRHWTGVGLARDARIAPNIACFELLCDAVDTLLAAKRFRKPMAVAGRELRAQLSEYLSRHKAIYGDTHIRPKHHWAFDVCDQLETDSMVIDAFTLERLHLRIRKNADHACTLHNYENTILSSVTNLQAVRAENAIEPDTLIGRSEPFPGMPSVAVTDAATTRGESFHVGDYASRSDGSIGRVVACACEGGVVFLIVDKMIVTGRLTSQCIVCLEGGGRAVWRSVEAVAVLAWRREPDGSWLILTR